jgi:hypothetical protein
MTSAVLRAWFAGLLFAFSGVVSAQSPEGEPVASTPLKDAEFGVSTRHFALQRRVEMYQWQREASGYRQVWSAEPIDSGRFDAAHRNPGEFPLQTRYWVASDVTLDGRPVDEEVLKRLGSWHGFRPGFTALPGNLAATFQPEGDGLSSAENPLSPRVGDLRVTWRELRLPDLAGKVALQQGEWVLDEAALVASDAAAVRVDAGSTGAAADSSGSGGWPASMIAGVVLATTLLALLVALLASRRRRGGRRR